MKMPSFKETTLWTFAVAFILSASYGLGWYLENLRPLTLKNKLRNFDNPCRNRNDNRYKADR